MMRWLERNHLPKSGRNKDVLARRILRHMVGEETSDDEDHEEIDAEESAAECHPRLPVCPGKDDGQWIELKQPEQIPNVREEDVLNYFLHGKNPVTGGKKNCRRYLDKARRYSMEPKYIGQLGVCELGEYEAVRCHVRPSMRKGIYYCTVTMYKDTGMVVTGSCDCKVGATGLCSHVGGVLLRLVRLRNPCTSRLCGWGMPASSLKKAVQPQKLVDINWWPGKSDFLDGLESANPTCTLYVHKRRTNFDINPFLDTFMVPCLVDDSVNLEELWIQDLFEDYVEDLTVPVELSCMIEKSTRGQACNPLWIQARSFIITASYFGTIVNRKASTPPENLLKYICGYQTLPKTKAMEYGSKFEARARKLYLKKHHQTCGGGDKMVEVQVVGLVVSPKHPYLGASLDGFINCPKCGKGGLEIKCPWKFR